MLERRGEVLAAAEHEERRAVVVPGDPLSFASARQALANWPSILANWPGIGVLDVPPGLTMLEQVDAAYDTYLYAGQLANEALDHKHGAGW